jgi:hydroxyethylthiazole kinase-like uncharacterized protein yjeF
MLYGRQASFQGMEVKDEVAYATADEMRALDRAASDEFGLDSSTLMENAGRSTAALAEQLLGGSPSGKRVAVLVGKGSNGGDGLVAGRHLHNHGAAVSLYLGSSDEFEGLAGKHLAIAVKMGIGVEAYEGGFGAPDLIVDALLGYGLKGNPREPAARMIRNANSSGVQVLAVDLPSGLDATSGEPYDPCSLAAATITMGLPKTGFLALHAKKFLGQVYVADISFPKALYDRTGSRMKFDSRGLQLLL